MRECLRIVRMTICLRCHRPLKRPTESGLGPVCARAVMPAPAADEPDLFEDIDFSVIRANARVKAAVEFQSLLEKRRIQLGFEAARKQLGVAA